MTLFLQQDIKTFESQMNFSVNKFSEIGVNAGGIKFQKGFSFVVLCLKRRPNALAKPSTWLIIPCIPWVKRCAFNFNIRYYIPPIE